MKISLSNMLISRNRKIVAKRAKKLYQANMRVVITTKPRTLVSLPNEELIALSNCLNEILNNSNIDERDCSTRIGIEFQKLKTLHQEFTSCIKSEKAKDLEIFHGWVDGCSIQIQAISAYGDPADLGEGEVKSMLKKLINEAEKT